ncbi:MAG TPA: DUF192 domain-containing protein [Kofleriaceae bacterium]|nr:DUF192 domain-containing protein [Kofleriaceae bacterium]
MRCLLLIALFASCSSGAKRDDGPAVSPRPHDAIPASSPAAAPAPTKMPKVYLSTPQGELVVAVEIVSTEAAIERGLMYRQHLPPDDGMLFLMREDRIWSFWMRNTLIPLDIIFITKDMTIAGIAENAEPRTETLREVDKPSLYVLEVNGGYCAAHKVAAGAKVRFEAVPPR